MSLSGKYTHVRDEGQYEHMIANGFSEDRAKDALEQGKVLEISISGGKVTFTRSGHARPERSLPLNQETDEIGPDGKPFKSKVVMNGDVLTVDIIMESVIWKRVYSLAGSELTLTSISSKPGVPDGKRIYKKE